MITKMHLSLLGVIIIAIFISGIFYSLSDYDLLDFIPYANAELTEMTGMGVSGSEENVYLIEKRDNQSYEGLPSKYDAGIQLIGIGEINKSEGTYEMDFWFWITVHEKDDPTDFTQQAPEFDFINAKEIKFDSTFVDSHYFETRVQGTFRNIMDFRDFPFEELQLKVLVEPKNPSNINSVVFVLDPESSIDPLASVPGFQVETFDMFLKENMYSEDDVYSQFEIDFIVQRNFTGSVIKSIFPITLITGLSLLIFWIPENFTPRIYLTAPLLLSLVYLHRAVVGEIPTIGYLTLFDKIIIVYYVLFLNSILSLALQMRYHVTHKDDMKIIKINKIMRYFIPVIIIIGLIILLPL